MLYQAVVTTSTSQAIPWGARNPKRGYNLYLLDTWEEADNELLKTAVTEWSNAKILFEIKQRAKTLGNRSTKRQNVLNKFIDALKTETWNRWPKARPAIIILREARNRNKLGDLANDIAAWAAAEDEEAKEAENRQDYLNCESDDDLPDMSAKKQKA